MSLVMRYLPQMTSDYLRTRGVVMLLVGIGLMLPLLVVTRAAEGMAPTPELAVGMLKASLQNVSVFLSLVGMAGIVGNDVRQGYFRFIFAKPLSPPAYYGVAFAVALVSVGLVLLCLTGFFALFVLPVWPGTTLLDVMLRVTLLGSLVFAFSRFTRLDWLFGFILLLAAELLRARFPRSGSVVGSVFHVVLPPDLPNMVFTPAGPMWGDIAWGLSYAALAVAVGLAAVRLVPLGRT